MSACPASCRSVVVLPVPGGATIVTSGATSTASGSLLMLNGGASLSPSSLRVSSTVRQTRSAALIRGQVGGSGRRTFWKSASKLGRTAESSSAVIVASTRAFSLRSAELGRNELAKCARLRIGFHVVSSSTVNFSGSASTNLPQFWHSQTPFSLLRRACAFARGCSAGQPARRRRYGPPRRLVMVPSCAALAADGRPTAFGIRAAVADTLGDLGDGLFGEIVAHVLSDKLSGPPRDDAPRKRRIRNKTNSMRARPLHVCTIVSCLLPGASASLGDHPRTAKMPKILPSHVVTAIDSMFGPTRNELDSRAVTHVYRAEVHALLALLDEVPRELIDLSSVDYLEFSRCRSVLATSAVRWNVGDMLPARDVGGKDAVERIRRLMRQCHDELPPVEPELPFIADIDIRLGIEDRIRAAWTDFNAREWMGATVFAGAALEALLLWALKQVSLRPTPKKRLDELHLADLIRLATENGVIDAACEQQASLARDARNLVHPGKALRSGGSCNKTTALTGLTAVYRVIDRLKATH